MIKHSLGSFCKAMFCHLVLRTCWESCMNCLTLFLLEYVENIIDPDRTEHEVGLTIMGENHCLLTFSSRKHFLSYAYLSRNYCTLNAFEHCLFAADNIAYVCLL